MPGPGNEVLAWHGVMRGTGSSIGEAVESGGGALV